MFQVIKISNKQIFRGNIIFKITILLEPILLQGFYSRTITRLQRWIIPTRSVFLRNYLYLYRVSISIGLQRQTIPTRSISLRDCLPVLISYGTLSPKRSIFAFLTKSSTVSTSTIISPINEVLAYIDSLGEEAYINITQIFKRFKYNRFYFLKRYRGLAGTCYT